MTRKQSNLILVLILVAVVLAGVSVALFGGAMVRVKVLGDFFLTSLRMIVVPLVVASVIVGITRLGDLRQVRGVGGRTLLYYAITTALAVGLGLLLVSVIQPGVGMPLGFADPEAQATLLERLEAKRAGGWNDIILSLVTPNIVQALADGQMLPIILFALIFGGILTTMGEEGRPLIALFEILNEAILRFVGLIMWLAPVGIFGLVASKFGAAVEEGTLAAMLGSLGQYMGTVLLGLGIHGILVLPLVCLFLARRSPLALFVAMCPALATAWSTASSSATLPLTLECATERAGIAPKTAGFVLPLGATINMDGTALYEAVAAVFIAQAYGIELSGAQLLLVFVTATLVSIGAAGIPEAGLFMMVIVLEAVHLPIEGIGLIFAVDWLLDRFRTAINVWGDAVGAAYIDRVTGPDLVEPPELVVQPA